MNKAILIYNILVHRIISYMTNLSVVSIDVFDSTDPSRNTSIVIHPLFGWLVPMLWYIMSFFLRYYITSSSVVHLRFLYRKKICRIVGDFEQVSNSYSTVLRTHRDAANSQLVKYPSVVMATLTGNTNVTNVIEELLDPFGVFRMSPKTPKHIFPSMQTGQTLVLVGIDKNLNIFNKTFSCHDIIDI
jgi:hypothetical protein